VASFILAPDSAVSVWFAVVTCLVIGAAIGSLNGFLIVKLRVPDLVTTLATFSIVQGFALIVRPAPGGTSDPGFTASVLQRVGLVPIVFIAAVGLYTVTEMVLLRGRIGGRLYATGASVEAAKVVGIGTDALRFWAYVFSGVLAAIAGLMIFVRIGSGDPQAGAAFSLSSVTAAVVGGTSVFGGSGTAAGTFLGSVLIILLQNVLNQLQVSAYWQYIWTGLLTLIAVGFYGLRTTDRRMAMEEKLRRLVSFKHRAIWSGNR
jgi:ribose transport system ATP-binding protein